MALVYYRTLMTITDNDGRQTNLNFYRNCDDTIYATHSANTEVYAQEVAVKENAWFNLSSPFTITTSLITKTEYNKWVPDAIDPNQYLEDLTPPEILSEPNIE